MVDLQKLSSLIESRRTRSVKLGSAKNAPSAEWLEKAETRLGKPLAPSYKWFLTNYGGGEIGGEEIFSIYGMEFETVFGGDIVFQYLSLQRSGTIAPAEVPLSQTDQGELFYLDLSSADPNGEYPVFVKRGKSRVLYAPDFASFLQKRILAHCP